MARVALVTGGTRGIGRAISMALMAAGYKVAASYAGNDEAAAKFKEETGIAVYKFDVGDFDACAAAIAQHLQPGHLVLAEQIHGEDDQFHPTDTAWRTRLAEGLPANLTMASGIIRESRRVLGTRTEKAALQQKTGALAVDMESGAIARTAGSHQLPFLAVRAIADPAGMDFPAAVTRSLNPRGDVRMIELLGHLARRPGQIPDLIRLGQAFGAAMHTLHQVRQHAGSDFSLTASSPRP